MKKYILLPLLLFCGTTMFAQDQILEMPIGWRGSGIELHTISDKEKQQNCLFLLNDDSIKGLLLDSKGAIAMEFNTTRLTNEKLLGGFIKENRIYVYLLQSSKDQLHICIFNTATGQREDSYLPFELKKQRMVDRISCGDHFLYFTVNKKASEFIVYDFRDEKGFDTLHYHFTDEVWEDLSRYGGMFSRDVNVAKVDLEGECSVDIAQTPNKIYLVHDTLYLLMNKGNGSTSVYSFDTQHKQVHFKKINHNYRSDWVDPAMGYTDNSFLLKGRLYFVSATPDSLCVQVIDLASEHMLKKFITGKKDEISFKNTPIIQEGGAYSSTLTKELGKTRQLLRKMLNGAVIIATSDDHGQIYLTIGSYTKVSQGGGAHVFFPGGMTGIPIIVPTGGFSRGGWTKSARFTALLDEKTLEHVAGEPKPPINERIEKYTEGIKIPPEAENLFMHNGKYIYAYYNKTERKVVLTNF